MRIALQIWPVPVAGAASASGLSSASGGGHDETEPPASGGGEPELVSDRLDRMQAHIDALEEKMQVISRVVKDLAWGLNGVFGGPAPGPASGGDGGKCACNAHTHT